MKIIFTFVLWLLSSSLWAGGWSNPLTIKQIYIYGDFDWIHVATEGGSVYTPNCISDSWEIKATNPGSKDRMYSALMAAQMSGKTIRLWYGDTCGVYDYHITNGMRLVSD